MVYTCELFASILFVHNHFSPCSCRNGQSFMVRRGGHASRGVVAVGAMVVSPNPIVGGGNAHFGYHQRSRFASARLGLKARRAWLKYHQLHRTVPTTRYHQSQLASTHHAIRSHPHTSSHPGIPCTPTHVYPTCTQPALPLPELQPECKLQGRCSLGQVHFTLDLPRAFIRPKRRLPCLGIEAFGNSPPTQASHTHSRRHSGSPLVREDGSPALGRIRLPTS